MFWGKQQRVHRRVTELLPWWVNDSLSAGERGLVDQHLRQCEQCRQARDSQQRLMDLLREEPMEMDYQPALRSLMRRIDVLERERRVVDDVFARPRPARRWLPSLSLAGLALLVSALLLQPWNSAPDPLYRTLTAGPPPSAAAPQRALLSFARGSDAEQVRQVLVSLNAVLIDRPDDQGRYLVELQVPPDRTLPEFMASIEAMSGVVDVSLPDPGARNRD